MGFSRHYLKANIFVLTKICGEVNDYNLREHIIAFKEETKGMSRLRELADCRGIENLENLTVSGTTRNAQIVDNRPDYLSALLVNDSTLLYGMARSFQMFFEESRKEVKIFKDIDDALDWLAIDDQEKEILKDFVNIA